MLVTAIIVVLSHNYPFRFSSRRSAASTFDCEVFESFRSRPMSSPPLPSAQLQIHSFSRPLNVSFSETDSSSSTKTQRRPSLARASLRPKSQTFSPSPLAGPANSYTPFPNLSELADRKRVEEKISPSISIGGRQVDDKDPPNAGTYNNIPFPRWRPTSALEVRDSEKRYPSGLHSETGESVLRCRKAHSYRKF